MSGTIVLAHEDAMVSQEVQGALETAGYTVTPVTTGQAAWNLCQTALPDMLILGNVPDAEPLSVLQQLRGDCSTEDIRMMWLMPVESDEAVKRAWNAGMDGVVNPPICGEEIACLARLLFEGPGALEGENRDAI
jgi:DNA-binding response OmpR family regulator